MYYAQHVKHQGSASHNGVSVCMKSLLCTEKLKELLLIALLPVCLRFSIHFRLTEILCGALGL